jgi:hypothetical protein
MGNPSLAKKKPEKKSIHLELKSSRFISKTEVNATPPPIPTTELHTIYEYASIQAKRSLRFPITKYTHIRQPKRCTHTPTLCAKLRSCKKFF